MITFFYPTVPHLALHPFPTRRSSDLPLLAPLPVELRCGHALLPARLVHNEVQPEDQRGHGPRRGLRPPPPARPDRKSTRLNSSHTVISYAVFCLKKKKH